MIPNYGNEQFSESIYLNNEPEPSEETKQKLKNPFDNPTEYLDYREDYSKVLPWLKMPDYKLPFEPARTEKKILKRSYSIGGSCVVLHFITSQVAALLLMLLIQLIIKALNPGVDSEDISDYMSYSSILSSINMLIYLTANVLFAGLGLKWAKIKSKNLFKPLEFNLTYAVEYCLIGLALWNVSAYISTFIEYIFQSMGYSSIVESFADNELSPLGNAVMNIYSCIIAPITEEIFYRGMVLKVFSKANQRFAIFASAFLFGLGHGNIPQFALAFTVGIFFAHITLKHNSIVPSIIVHVCINSFATLTSLLSSSAVGSGIIFIFTIAATIIGLLLLLMFRKKDRLPATTPAQTRRGFAIAKTSATFVLSICLLIISTIFNTMFLT